MKGSPSCASTMIVKLCDIRPVACRGCVTCVKLSPNLRRVSQGDGKQTAKELEVAKLEKVIEVALKGIAEAS